jgi:hypothetical protein
MDKESFSTRHADVDALKKEMAKELVLKDLSVRPAPNCAHAPGKVCKGKQSRRGTLGPNSLRNGGYCKHLRAIRKS